MIALPTKAQGPGDDSPRDSTVDALMNFHATELKHPDNGGPLLNLEQEFIADVAAHKAKTILLKAGDDTTILYLHR